MIRWGFFVLLASAATAYALWIYLRVDLAVPSARRLAAVRATSLIVVLLLLFDVRVPTEGIGGVPTDWVLLDASLSMGASPNDGGSPWVSASARARELEADGWNVVTFAGEAYEGSVLDEATPTAQGSMLAPALARAAEGGARRVTVLSDLRIEDPVAVYAALETLPLAVEFEAFGDTVANVGVVRLDVPDFAQPGEAVTAEIEVHGAGVGDSITIAVSEEETVVATVTVAAPQPGLRSRAHVSLPSPMSEGRVRYTASASAPGDVFSIDDVAVDYAAVGHEEGALVLISLTPDWEPRYLLPVLGEVTGLPAVGYLRAGPDRFVQAGRAIDRGSPIDSAGVRRAAADAALVVVHGVGGDIDSWARSLLGRPGRQIVMTADPAGARAMGIETGAAASGEWYVSADVPSSPIAGALSGVAFQGLPPLTDVLVPTSSDGSAPLLVQLRGAGSPEGALHLADRPSGRVAIVLASGFWRWAARESGQGPYRRLWSGIAGWLLADQAVLAAESRPSEWVYERGAQVMWSVPPDGTDARVVVRADGETVVDTLLAAGELHSLGALDPASYAYTVQAESGDTLGVGRFDVARTTEEMLPLPQMLAAPAQRAGVGGADGGRGRPLRTSPWPYLLVISLLCLEWIFRRRSGLR